MFSRNQTCASCTRFPRVALEGDGKAVCDGLEQERRYDWPACPLHINAKGEDLRARRLLADKLKDGT